MLARSDLAGAAGALLLAASPPFIDTDAGKLAAIAGLSLLTVQAIDLRLYNLIALNSFSILGYLYALLL